MSEWIVLFLLTLCVLGLGIYNLRTSIYSDHATIGARVVYSPKINLEGFAPKATLKKTGPKNQAQRPVILPYAGFNGRRRPSGGI